MSLEAPRPHLRPAPIVLPARLIGQAPPRAWRSQHPVDSPPHIPGSHRRAIALGRRKRQLGRPVDTTACPHSYGSQRARRHLVARLPVTVQHCTVLLPQLQLCLGLQLCFPVLSSFVLAMASAFALHGSLIGPTRCARQLRTNSSSSQLCHVSHGAQGATVIRQSFVPRATATSTEKPVATSAFPSVTTKEGRSQCG